MAIEYVIFVLAIVLFIVFIAIWSLHFISLIYGKFKFHKKSKHPIDRDKCPGVSIIKPLMGIDDNLRDNLETFFTMDYPKYELLFCVQDSMDPVISLVRELIDSHPDVDARLFFGGKQVGINPKINNMMQGYQTMKYDLFLISDAGLKMNKDTLYDMVCLMKEKVGLVHQMPFVCDRPGFAGVLEKVYFGTSHCRMYLFINLIGVNCVTGMSCLMRREVIDKAGGLQKFGNYIAEDFFLAQEFLDNNWKIQVSHQPAMQNSANYSVSTWQKRMIRWCKLRLKLSVMSWLEPMQDCFMLGVCTSWTVNYLFGWSSLVFFLVHVLSWFICDYMLLKITQNGRLPFSKFEYVVAWLYREGTCFYLFLRAASNPTVKWRNGQYRLKWGGLAEEIVATNKSKDTLKSQSSTNKLLNSNGTSNDFDDDDDEDDDNNSKNNGRNTGIIGSNEVIISKPMMNEENIESQLMISGQQVPAKIARAPLLNHKRTSSFTNLMMTSNASAKTQTTIVERENASTSGTHLYPFNKQQLQTNAKSPSLLTTSPRSHHQHHQYNHSISNPLQLASAAPIISIDNNSKIE